MGQDVTAEGASKRKFRVWLPIVACPLGIVVGRCVGKYTVAALGFQIPPVPAGVPTSLYDGRIPGAIYGGIGALVAGSIIGLVAHRWKPWVALAISLVGGLLFAALGAVLER
jgi:vacuolar-type H+-ATPase subunit I/STV1